MTTKTEIQNRAFKNYLVSIPRQVAVVHVFECLRGASGVMAWELMAEAHGPKWSCSPEEIPTLINEAINKARIELLSEYPN